MQTFVKLKIAYLLLTGVTAGLAGETTVAPFKKRLAVIRAWVRNCVSVMFAIVTAGSNSDLLSFGMAEDFVSILFLIRIDSVLGSAGVLDLVIVAWDLGSVEPIDFLDFVKVPSILGSTAQLSLLDFAGGASC